MVSSVVFFPTILIRTFLISNILPCADSLCVCMSHESFFRVYTHDLCVNANFARNDFIREFKKTRKAMETKGLMSRAVTVYWRAL